MLLILKDLETLLENLKPLYSHENTCHDIYRVPGF